MSSKVASANTLDVSHRCSDISTSQQTTFPTNFSQPLSLSSNINYVTQWLKALGKFDSGNLQAALQLFMYIEPKNSKISYNVGLIYATLGDYDKAILHYKSALEQDNFMAISFFQIGVSQFLSMQYRKAAVSFNNALKLMRGNSVINYQQLGLEYKLYSCEIMYNRALSYIYSGQIIAGIHDLGFAVKEKRYVSEHNILDSAFQHFCKPLDSEQSQHDNLKNINTTSPGKNDHFKIENSIHLPLKHDTKHKRFSLVSPPMCVTNDKELDNNNKPLTSTDSNRKSKNSDDQKSSMVYSLFSAPQNSVFRLTEAKIKYILGDKYASIMMMTTHHAKLTNLGNTRKNYYDRPPTPLLTKEFFSKPDQDQSNTSSTLSSTHLFQPNDNSDQCCDSSENEPLLLSDESLNNSLPESPLSSVSVISESHFYDTTDNGTGTFHESIKLKEVVSRSPDHHRKDVLPSENQYCRNRDDYNNSRHVDILGSSMKDSTSSSFYTTAFAGTTPNNELSSCSQNEDLRSSCVFKSTSITALKTNFNTTIKLKIHYKSETRVMMISRQIMFTEFVSRIQAKLGCYQVTSNSMIQIRVIDEEGDSVLLGDQEDLSVALDELCSKNDSKPKLTVYVD